MPPGADRSDGLVYQRPQGEMQGRADLRQFADCPFDLL